MKRKRQTRYDVGYEEGYARAKAFGEHMVKSQREHFDKMTEAREKHLYEIMKELHELKSKRDEVYWDGFEAGAMHKKTEDKRVKN